MGAGQITHHDLSFDKFPTETMDDDLSGRQSRFPAEYRYTLRDPNERFTETQFDRVQRQILIWSLHEEIPCAIELTGDGFTVTVHHSRQDGNDVYRHSLEAFLKDGIFRELISDGISLTYIPG